MKNIVINFKIYKYFLYERTTTKKYVLIILEERETLFQFRTVFKTFDLPNFNIL